MQFQKFTKQKFCWRDSMFKRKSVKADYDRENQIPLIRASICNGEQVAGFKELYTGKFHEVSFIRNDRELKAFMDEYGIDSITKEY